MLRLISNLKIFSKVLLLALALIGFLASIGLNAIRTMGDLNRSTEKMYKNNFSRA